MIFVTVGTEKFPFDRLLKALDEAAVSGRLCNDIFAQTGSSNYKPKSFAFRDFLDFNEMVENIKRADIVIAHAGVGSTLLTLSLGKVPVIFPRQRKFREHVDDHQLEFAKKMDETGKVIVAYGPEELIEKINNYNKLLSGLKRGPSEGKAKLVEYLIRFCENL
ncbi:MAG: glycosyltransferase [Candidatus Omnitrophota bacterium]